MSMSMESRQGNGGVPPKASRRRLLGMAGGLAALGVLRGSAGAQTGTPEAAATGEWTFTDDLGVTITLPQRPQRIVADLKAAAPLWDFGIQPLAVSGWSVGTDTAWGNVDRATPNITVSSESSEPDLEQLIALKPDLFVTATWLVPDAPYEWSFPDQETFDRVNAIAPVVALSAVGSGMANTARYAELAEALGADPEASGSAAARAEVEALLAELDAFVTEHPDLTVLFMAGDGEGISVANPGPWAELSMYQDLGLPIIEPDVDPAEFWQQLSTEEANRYPADVIFQSTRANRLTPEELQAHATYALHPAIAAGQIGPWNQDFIFSYQGMAASLSTLLATLNDAEDVTP